VESEQRVPDRHGVATHRPNNKELPNRDRTTCRKERFIEGQTAGLSLSG
jgi:hypothetical protein